MLCRLSAAVGGVDDGARLDRRDGAWCVAVLVIIGRDVGQLLRSMLSSQSFFSRSF